MKIVGHIIGLIGFIGLIIIFPWILLVVMVITGINILSSYYE